MHGTRGDLERYLDELARQARPGDRLPPIRDLMRRFGASQQVVQRALRLLHDQGLIAAQVGRGTFFAGGAGAAPAAAAAPATAPAPRARSILLLRRTLAIMRGRVLMEGLQRRFTEGGHRVLEVAYTDPDHALTVLKGLPPFDACVVQSTFKILTIELLAALRAKCSVLAVDGTSLAGCDVEVAGLEWGEPLAAAVELLHGQGHRRIAYATTAHPFLANQLGRRRFDELQRTRADLALTSLVLPGLPGEGYEETLVERLQALRGEAAALPFTALVTWGIEDGVRLRRLLADAGIAVPAALSVVLLGRTDLDNEHAGHFDVVGCRVADQIETLHRCVVERWADASRPYGVQLIPVDRRAGRTVAPPPSDGVPAGRLTAPARPG
ncbi:MAG: GntR family transcriptional regulator [Rubrivivax sp.]